MKRSLRVFVALGLLAALVGCGNGEEIGEELLRQAGFEVLKVEDIEEQCTYEYIDIGSDWSDVQARFLDAKVSLLASAPDFDKQKLEDMPTENVEELNTQFEANEAIFSQTTDSVIKDLNRLQDRTKSFINEYANSGIPVCDEVVRFAEEAFPLFEAKVSSIFLQERALVVDYSITNFESAELIFNDANTYLYEGFCDFAQRLSQLTDNKSILEGVNPIVSLCRMDGVFE